MAYWWQRYNSTPDSNSSTPPDGAPENHFPDQVNNIQRQAMAAVNEIGQLVLGVGDGSPAPQSLPTGINNDFLKIIYDQLLPVNTIQGWDSNGGVDPFPTPAGTAFASVVWELCDSTASAGTPDFQDKLISGANSLAGPSQRFTGDTRGSNTTSANGGFTPSGTVAGHAVSVNEMPSHDHGVSQSNHNHGGSTTTATRGQSTGGQPGSSSGINQIGGVINIAGDLANISINNRGNGATHTHGWTGNAEPDHDHTIDPASSALELYKRIS